MESIAGLAHGTLIHGRASLASVGLLRNIAPVQIA
jgi:hypothetical protein